MYLLQNNLKPGLMLRAILAMLIVLLLGGQVQAEVEVPRLEQRVTDLTGTLSASQVQELNNRLAALEEAKGAQVAVLILPSTQPETIEQFGIRVAEAWKLGRKGMDDGALLLIAKDDLKLRIEVGYGLEGALNDATAKHIAYEIIKPKLKRGDFYKGIDVGLNAIISVIETENLPAPEQHHKKSILREFGFIIGLAIFVIGTAILPRVLGRVHSGLAIGGLIGGLTWTATHDEGFAFQLMFGAFVLSIFLYGWPSLFRRDRAGNARGSDSVDSDSTIGGDSSGGSSRESDRDKDDFRGGGGEFGGGGASSETSDSGGSSDSSSGGD